MVIPIFVFLSMPAFRLCASPRYRCPLRALSISCADELGNNLPLTDAHCAELRAFVRLEECPAVGAQDSVVRAPHPDGALLVRFTRDRSRSETQ